MSTRGGRKSAGLYLSFNQSTFDQIQAVAAEVGLSPHEFLDEIVAADLASRRLKSIPPTTRKVQGHRSDLLGYGERVSGAIPVEHGICLPNSQKLKL